MKFQSVLFKLALSTLVILSLCLTTAVSATTPPTSLNFTRSLKLGTTGADVKQLQIFLNTHGFTLATSGPGSPGHETTYYGSLTASAVSKFQLKYKSTVLTPLHLTTPTGIFGPSSLKQLNLLNHTILTSVSTSGSTTTGSISTTLCPNGLTLESNCGATLATTTTTLSYGGGGGGSSPVVTSGGGGSPPPVTHTITASTGSHGSITPSGAVTVDDAASQSFTLTPSSGYRVNTLTVDGDSVSTSSPYTFSDVTTDHTIAVTFSLIPDTTTPTPGSITFSGVTDTSITTTATGASDNVALAALPYNFHNVTSSTFSGATSTAVTFSGLTSNTSYTFENVVKDLSGNVATSTTYATTTLSGPSCTAPTITSSLTASATQDSAFSYTITASGDATITFGATSLPSGLIFSSPTISGTPTATGTTDVSLTATNSCGSDGKTLALTVGTTTQVGSWTRDANGWTVITPSYDSRIIYVSSSGGNDSNDGLSTTTPVATLAKGVTLLRNGYPDELLLKRGDTWNEAFGTLPTDIAGRSASEPMLFGAYGSGDRPIVASGNQTGLETNGYDSATNGTNYDSNYIAIIGINFQANDADTTNNPAGVELTYGDTLLIEDCEFSYYDDNIIVASASNVTVRRNIIVNAYSAAGAHAEGLYADSVTGLAIEDNVFDHNGWLGSNRNSPVPAGAGPDIFNHNVYIQYTCSGVTFINNISANASSHGLQMRAGGPVEDNLFVDDPLAMMIGQLNDPIPPLIESIVNGNVILNGVDINSGTPRGDAIEITNVVDYALVTDNIMAHNNSPTHYDDAIQIDIGTTPPAASGVTVTGNIIYGWFNNIDDQTGNATTTPNDIDDTGYTNPNLTLGDYSASLGGTNSYDAFLATAESRSAGTWDDNYTALAAVNYIRAGFDKNALVLPPIISFSAGASIVTSGSGTTLSWTSNNATSCVASNGWSGAQATSGAQGTGSLTTTTTYTLTCTGAGGSNSQSVTVTVSTTPAPTIDFSALPTSVNSGHASTLTWSSTDANYCNASDGWSGSVATSSSQSTGNLTADTTFTLTCTGDGGSNYESVTVTIASSTGSGPVAYYSMDSDTISGASLTDVSGNANTMTLVGSSTSVSGQIGQALNFPTGAYAFTPSDSGSSNVLTAVDNITMAAWINPATSSSHYRVIVSNGRPDATGYDIWLDGDSGGKLEVFCPGVGVVGSSYIPPANVWTHVVATRNSGTWTIYVNGSPITTTNNTITPRDPSNGGYWASTSMGDTVNTQEGAEGWSFDGAIDDARFYNQALSADDVTALYNAGQ